MQRRIDRHADAVDPIRLVLRDPPRLAGLQAGGQQRVRRRELMLSDQGEVTLDGAGDRTALGWLLRMCARSLNGRGSRRRQ